MNYRIPALILFLLLASCKKEPALVFSTLSLYEDQLSECENELCPEISISYLEVTGDTPNAQAINDRIEKYIIATLNIGEDETPSAKTIEEAAVQFIRIYREHKAEYFDMTAEYEIGIDIQHTYQSDELISLQLDQYMYSGGAHGFSKTEFFNFDPGTGEFLNKEELLSDESGFKKLAEEFFRNQFELSEGASINEPGFWFEDDSFQLSEAIGFAEDQVVLIYNPYEIAPYSEGAVEVRIPIDDAKKFLSISVD